MNDALARARLRLTPAIYSLPAGRRLVTMARYLSGGSLDALDAALGRTPDLTPPRRLRFVGTADFHAIGQEFLGHFRELAGLEPHDRVLDVGCGIGRMAVPLTRYLQAPGSYEGFDVVPVGVRWCQANITPRFPNFHFRVVDVYNQRYNPDGVAASVDHIFPYEDGSFDFAFATSVFTHMLPADVDRYVAELARVLSPGGRCLVTFYLTGTNAPPGDRAAAPALRFEVQEDGYRTVSRRVPEVAIAYEEAEVRRMFDGHGLRIHTPISYGAWSGRSGRSHQDIVVATRS